MNSNTKNLVLRYILWALVLAVMVFIFVHSAQGAEQSSDTSGTIVKAVLTVVVKDFKALPEVEQQQAIDSFQFIARKSAHFCVYFALGALCFLAMNTYKVKLKTKLITSLTISWPYAVSDEIHQLFVPGRACQLRDVLIDFSGALTGILLAWAFIAVLHLLMNKRGVSYEKEGAY